MSDYAHDDPTGPASVGGADTVGDVEHDDSARDETDRVGPVADPETEPDTDGS